MLVDRRLRMLSFSLVAAVAACAERPLPVQPLPTLVSEAPRRVEAIASAPLWLGGEQLSWDVSWRGVSVGRAHLATGDAHRDAPSRAMRTVRSRFRTHGLAARMSTLRHDLATREGDPVLRRDRVHTLHSAIATLRAWATPERPAAYLIVRFDDVSYRLDVARPMRDSSHLRVDCRLTPRGERAGAFALSMWLTDDALRVPARVEIEDRRGRVTAQLIERTL